MKRFATKPVPATPRSATLKFITSFRAHWVVLPDLELDDDADRRRKDKRNAAKLAAIEQEKLDEAEAWADTIATAKMFSPEAVEDVLKRRAKRENELKTWGWHRMRYGAPTKKTYFSA